MTDKEDAIVNNIVNNPAYYCTDLQYKFYMRALYDYGIELDMRTYRINRGRGWSKADGTCSSSVYDMKKRTCYCLYYPLRCYLSKKNIWDIDRPSNYVGNEYFIYLKTNGYKIKPNNNNSHM